MVRNLDFNQVDLKKFYEKEIVIFILAKYGSLTPMEILELNRNHGFNKSKSSIYRYIEILKNAKKIIKEKSESKKNRVPLILTEEGKQFYITTLQKLDLFEFVNEFQVKQLYREIELFFNECVFSLTSIEKHVFRQLYTELNSDYFASKIPTPLYNYMLLYITFRHPDTLKYPNLSEFISKLPFSSHLNLDLEKHFMKFIKILLNNNNGPKLKKLIISINGGEENLLVLENDSFIKKIHSLIDSQIDSIIYDKNFEHLKLNFQDRRNIILGSKGEINKYYKSFPFIPESLEAVIRDRIYNKYVKNIPKIYKNSGIIRSLRKSIVYETFKDLFNKYPAPSEEFNNCSIELLNNFIDDAMKHLDKKENVESLKIVEKGLHLFENSYELYIIRTVGLLNLGGFKHAFDAIERAEKLFDRFYPHDDDKKVMIIELKMKTLFYNNKGIPIELFDETMDLYEYDPNILILDLGKKSYDNPWIQNFINDPKTKKQLNFYRKLYEIFFASKGGRMICTREIPIKNKLISE